MSCFHFMKPHLFPNANSCVANCDQTLPAKNDQLTRTTSNIVAINDDTKAASCLNLEHDESNLNSCKRSSDPSAEVATSQKIPQKPAIKPENLLSPDSCNLVLRQGSVDNRSEHSEFLGSAPHNSMSVLRVADDAISAVSVRVALPKQNSGLNVVLPGFFHGMPVWILHVSDQSGLEGRI